MCVCERAHVFLGNVVDLPFALSTPWPQEMARTSRGSDDHVKWRSRLLILNGMIREKIQHPNDFDPENHIHRLALKLCRKNVERATLNNCHLNTLFLKKTSNFGTEAASSYFSQFEV